jgi:hypothetical protein
MDDDRRFLPNDNIHTGTNVALAEALRDPNLWLDLADSQATLATMGDDLMIAANDPRVIDLQRLFAATPPLGMRLNTNANVDRSSEDPFSTTAAPSPFQPPVDLGFDAEFWDAPFDPLPEWMLDTNYPERRRRRRIFILRSHDIAMRPFTFFRTFVNGPQGERLGQYLATLDPPDFLREAHFVLQDVYNIWSYLPPHLDFMRNHEGLEVSDFYLEIRFMDSLRRFVIAAGNPEWQALMLSGAMVARFRRRQGRWSRDELAMMPTDAYYTSFTDSPWDNAHNPEGQFPVRITVTTREPGGRMQVTDRAIQYTVVNQTVPRGGESRYPMGNMSALNRSLDLEIDDDPTRVITWSDGDTPLMDVILTRRMSPQYDVGPGLPRLYFRFRGSAASELTSFTDRGGNREPNMHHGDHTFSMRHSSGASVQIRIRYFRRHNADLPIISRVAFIPYEDRATSHAIRE